MLTYTSLISKICIYDLSFVCRWEADGVSGTEEGTQLATGVGTFTDSDDCYCPQRTLTPPFLCCRVISQTGTRALWHGTVREFRSGWQVRVWKTEKSTELRSCLWWTPEQFLGLWAHCSTSRGGREPPPPNSSLPLLSTYQAFLIVWKLGQSLCLSFFNKILGKGWFCKLKMQR